MISLQSEGKKRGKEQIIMQYSPNRVSLPHMPELQAAPKALGKRHESAGGVTQKQETSS